VQVLQLNINDVFNNFIIDQHNHHHSIHRHEHNHNKCEHISIAIRNNICNKYGIIHAFKHSQQLGIEFTYIDGLELGVILCLIFCEHFDDIVGFDHNLNYGNNSRVRSTAM
jgi:hypothetical protein